jgi:hypothetical protein
LLVDISYLSLQSLFICYINFIVNYYGVSFYVFFFFF